MVTAQLPPTDASSLNDDDAPALALTYTDAGDPIPGDDYLEVNEGPLRAGVSAAADHRGIYGTPMPETALTWLGAVRPSTRAAAVEITRAAAAAGLGLELVWGMSTTGEHSAGYSCDYMTWSRAGTDHDSRIGDFVARYVWTHRWHLAVRYLIWDRRIRNVEIDAGRWRSYVGESTHTDHVHVCRYPRLYDPAWAAGLPVVLRKSLNVAILADWKPSSSGPVHPHAVGDLQRALNIVLGAGLTRDGIAGPDTRSALMRFQRQTRSPATGILSALDAGRLATAAGSLHIRG